MSVNVSSATLDRHTEELDGYPPIEIIRDLFGGASKVANLIRYSPTSLDDLFGQLQQVESIGGPNFHGIQLNAAWPDRNAVQQWTATRLHLPHHFTILECGPESFAATEGCPHKFAEKVREYKGAIHYVVLDPVGRTDAAFDPEFVLKHLRALHAEPGEIGYVVDGGFTSKTLIELASPILKEFPRVSIQAGSRLRTKHDGTTVLNDDLVGDFVPAAYELMRQYRLSA